MSRVASVIVLVPMLLGVPVLANADATPQFTLISPAPGSSINPTGAFDIVFDITGSSSSSWTACNQNPTPIVEISLDAPDPTTGDTSWVWYASPQEGDGNYWWSESSTTKTKIIPNGVQCTIHIDRIPTAIGSNNTLTIASMKSISMHWGFLADGPWQDGPPNLVTYQATPPAEPTIEIQGISRGQNIVGVTPYSIVMKVDKSLSPVQLTAGSVPAVSDCSKTLKSQSQSGSILTKVVDCLFRPFSITGSASITASMQTADGETFAATPVAVNLSSSLGYPIIQNLEPSIKYAPDSLPGSGTKIKTSITGFFSLVRAGTNSSSGDFFGPSQESIAQAKIDLKFCVGSSCSQLMGKDIGSDGSFSTSIETTGTQANWTLSGDINGLPITKDNLSFDENTNQFSGDFSKVSGTLSIQQMASARLQCAFDDRSIAVNATTGLRCSSNVNLSLGHLVYQRLSSGSWVTDPNATAGIQVLDAGGMSLSTRAGWSTAGVRQGRVVATGASFRGAKTLISNTFSITVTPAPVIMRPSGTVDRSSRAYRTMFNVGQNFAKVSTNSDTALLQCNSALKTGIIDAVGHPQYLGAQTMMIQSYLTTASGFQGCLDGFNS